MSEQELKQVNKVAVFCHAIIVAALLGAYVVEVFKGTRTVGYYAVFSALAAIPLIANLVLLKLNPANKLIKHILGFGYGIFYCFVIFTTIEPVAFTYAIPMLVVILLYNDLRYCTVISSSAVLANIIYTIYQAVAVGIPSDDIKTYEIRIAAITLVGLFLCLSTYVSAKINRVKMDDINLEKDNISRLLQHTVNVSGEITKGIGDVTGHMKELGGAVSETRNAMQEVSSGTNDTAESIQSQLGKTEEIQHNIEQLANMAESIAESMEQAKENVAIGRKNIDSLNEQMAVSERAGNEVVESMKSLEEYMTNVQSIIDLITSVASQTSLLALNASIEAARAGEAGRGFAVVATEISNLANQTQTATVNITEVIHNVSDKLDVAANAVEQLMSNSKKQSESANQAADSFVLISESTERVNEQSERLGNAVTRLTDANSAIVESIQTISAIMQEVSAHSQETYTVSERNTGIVGEVTRLVDNLNEQAQRLNIKA